jgi:hypothetical protein
MGTDKHRERIVAALRALLNERDPIGVRDEGDGPDDEYDCILVGLLGQLERGASANDLATYLQQLFRDHFGLTGPGYPIWWAERIVARYRSDRANPGECL